MKVTLNNQTIVFEPVTLNFDEGVFTNIFANKVNKTLQQTIEHRRYKKFADTIKKNYAALLNWKLGDFLFHLKENRDDFYMRFLNKNGDLNYTRFFIDDEQFLNKKGLYAYTVSEEIYYIGRCRDSFKKRINNGYGKIHPKNCFIDGQSTNCHLNNLITENKENVRLYICEMNDNDEIERTEKTIIRKLQPLWNIALKN